MFQGARVCAGVALAFALSTIGSAVDAQDAAGASLDREARSLFEAGSTAFDDARYGDALGYFRHAYELSHRPALLYNVGLAADRLRHDEEALAAFEQFLTEVTDSPRRRDVEARVAAIRSALEARRATTPVEPTHETHGTQEPTHETHGAEAPEDHPRNVPHETAATPAERAPDGSALWIAGPVTLGAVGVAGSIAAVVGIAGAGGCIDTRPTGCAEERATSWGAVGVYGGLGLAAIAGAVIWLVVGLGSDDDASPSVATRDGIPELSWRF